MTWWLILLIVLVIPAATVAFLLWLFVKLNTRPDRARKGGK